MSLAAAAFGQAAPASAAETMQGPPRQGQRQTIPPPENEIVVTGQRPVDEMLVVGRNASRTWRRAESRHFVVYSDAPEAELVREIQRFELFDAFLRRFIGARDAGPANKLELYLVGNSTRLAAVALESQGMIHDSRDHDLVHLFYTASPSAVVAGLNREFARGRVLGVIDDWVLHEYTHHVMLQHEPLATFPPWYFEGVAYYMAGTEIEGGHMDLAIAPAEAGAYLGRGGRMRYRDIILGADWHTLLDRPESDPQPTTFLVQSWLLVHYLLSDDTRRAALQAFMRDPRRQADQEAALTAALGIPITELEQRVRGHGSRLPGRRFTLDPGQPPPEVTVTLLPLSADQLLLPYGAMRRGIARESTRQSMLARVRRSAARFGDRFALRVLAFAEVTYGDPARADAALQRLVEAYPSDAEILYLSGLRHLAAARSLEGPARAQAMTEAQRWFARAYAVDPDHYPTLFRYAETLMPDAGAPSERMRDILVEAVELAPQVGAVRLAAAHVLLQREERDLAREVLETMLISSHNPLAGEAHALLQLVRNGGQTGRQQLQQAFAAR